MILDTVVQEWANQQNYNPNRRDLKNIKYIVIHYTGNVGDTAKNNADYFAREVVKSSAHYFVWEDTVYQSVPDNHAAYAVGLGDRKEPYIKWPSMWNKATNSNTISIEICGSKTSNEGSYKTKETAAKLTAELLHKYGLTPSCVIRHYDVTGKSCPMWAVQDPMKWLQFTLQVNQYYYGKEDDKLLDTPENYQVFKIFMDRYLAERAACAVTSSTDWRYAPMQYCENAGIIRDGRPESWVTRAELAAVVQRIK